MRKTASDNQEEHGNNAVKTLRTNLYVCDLLKSVRTCDVASKLVDDDVRMICTTGGFHFTRFIYNDKAAFITVSEGDRRQGVKNQLFQQKEPFEFNRI